MSQLENKTKNQIIAANVIEARRLTERLIGLMGEKKWPGQNALWIHRCNSIHTCFMRFPIDVVFVDRHLKVQAVIRNIQPWRFIWPIWRANSVFEMAAGSLKEQSVSVGDQLYVGA